jgi:Terpene cyclase DEP1
MVALIIHLFIAIVVIVVIVASNPQIFRRPATPKVSVLEAVYYVAGIAATVIGYYFNLKYVNDYSQGSHNAIWGDHGSWKEFIQLGWANPAVSSASSDYYIMSLVVLALFVIVDGRRRGVRHAWLYFLFVLTASSTFAWAFYLATVERQRRATASETPEHGVVTGDTSR